MGIWSLFGLIGRQVWVLPRLIWGKGKWQNQFHHFNNPGRRRFMRAFLA